jgi:hypothetical protein
MAKAFGWIMMLAALYFGMTIYTKGIDQANSDLVAPIASSDDRAPLATHLTPAAGMADAPSERRRRGRVTDVVRDRVTADLEAGALRRGYER